jgi:2-desacetyl-2-hydroxyethyl bacteriochlorophyllide A dehydrogenase
MHGWQFTEVGKPLTLVELPDPVPGPGQVVIDTVAAGLCHSDLSYMDGTLTPLLGPAPIILGHEMAGHVSAIGAGVSGISIGDSVAINADVDGPGTAVDGGYATKVLVRDSEVVLIPDGLSFEQAATATDAGRTSYHAVCTIGGVQRGTRLGIIGFGGLGSLGAEIAMTLGAEVYVAEINTGIHERILASGAKKVVSDARDLASDELDVIIDFAGFGSTTAAAVASVARQGRVVQVGLARREATIDIQDLVLREVQLLGSVTGSTSDVAAVMDLMAAGAISSKIVLTRFEDIQSSLERLERGEIEGRLVALFNE